MVTQYNKKHIIWNPLALLSPHPSTSDQLQPTTEKKKQTLLGLLSMGMACQTNIFWHYHYTFSVNGAQVGVLQEAHHKIFGSLLQYLDGIHLEMQVVCPLFLHYLMHQAYKRLLADDKLGAPVVLPYLTESHHPQPVPLGLFSPL